jgi:hypothetical protein
VFFHAITGLIFFVFHHLMPCVLDNAGHVDFVLARIFFAHIVFMCTGPKSALSDSGALALLIGDDFWSVEGVGLGGSSLK